MSSLGPADSEIGSSVQKLACLAIFTIPNHTKRITEIGPSVRKLAFFAKWSPSGILVSDGLGIRWFSMVFNGIQMVSHGLGWSRIVLVGLGWSASVDTDYHRIVQNTQT